MLLCFCFWFFFNLLTQWNIITEFLYLWRVCYVYLFIWKSFIFVFFLFFLFRTVPLFKKTKKKKKTHYTQIHVHFVVSLLVCHSLVSFNEPMSVCVCVYWVGAHECANKPVWINWIFKNIQICIFLYIWLSSGLPSYCWLFLPFVFLFGLSFAHYKFVISTIELNRKKYTHTHTEATSTHAHTHSPKYTHTTTCWMTLDNFAATRNFEQNKKKKRP